MLTRTDGTYEVPNVGNLPSVTTVLKTLSMVGIDTGMFHAAQSMVADAAPGVMEQLWGGWPWDKAIGMEAKAALAKSASTKMGMLADRGTVVHRYANNLSKEVLMDWEWFMESNGDLNPADGYEAMCDVLREWWSMHKPKTILSEWAGYNEEDRYAGSPDWYGVIGDHYWFLDFKTSSDWRLDHIMQVAAYSKFTHWEVGGKVVKADLHPSTRYAVVIVGEDKVRVYSPTDLAKWHNNFLRLLAVWYDWSKSGECQRVKELEYSVF